jgi:ADP-heptose:LPS heptosyltransferase
LAEQREGARFVSRAVPASQERIHVVDDYLRCAEFVGASPVPVSFDLPVHPSAATTIKHLLAGLRLPSDAPLIAINPSASVAWKSAAAAYWSQVVNALANDGTVLLVGSANQIGHHAEIARLSRARVYDFTGRTSLAELVALLRRCTIHVAPDTGSAHIAAALGCPVAGLYGPTPPWRKAPYGYEDLVAQRHDLCSSGCPRACRHKLQCLQAVTPDDLVGQARRALTRARTGHRRTDLC